MIVLGLILGIGTLKMFIKEREMPRPSSTAC